MASRRSGRHEGEGGVRFSRTLFIALLVLSGALIAFDRRETRSQAFSDFHAGFNDIAAPVLRLAAAPTLWVRNIGPRFRTQASLIEENEALREQLRNTRYWEDVARRQRDQIEIYETALNVNSMAAQDRIGAWTVADPSGPFVRARLIGRGRESGVADGYPVINPYGLVGRVYETGRRSARVLLLTDLNSRIPVMADRSNARAIMVGDNSAYPRLEYIGRQPDIEAGDRIVSSGDDGVLPRGVPVGEAVPTRDGGWRIRLYSDQAPVDFVWVWPYQPVTAPEDEASDPLNTVDQGIPTSDSPTTDGPDPANAIADNGAEAQPVDDGSTGEDSP